MFVYEQAPQKVIINGFMLNQIGKHTIKTSLGMKILETFSFRSPAAILT